MSAKEILPSAFEEPVSFLEDFEVIKLKKRKNARNVALYERLSPRLMLLTGNRSAPRRISAMPMIIYIHRTAVMSKLG
jgi:hypothetical protein